MKIMTYNIYEGGGSRLPVIADIIKEENPDFVALQEAVFEDPDLRTLGEQTGYEHHVISYAGKGNFNVASLSKFSFKTAYGLARFRNACLKTVIASEFGEITILNAHLTPSSEGQRLKELGIILNETGYGHTIILGDFNSLSPEDKYDTTAFNDTEKRKFTKDGRVRYEVIQRLTDAGYTDVAIHLGLIDRETVPPQIAEDNHGLPFRLDYIFVSGSLIPYTRYARVVRTEHSSRASDHYPLVAIFENVKWFYFAYTFDGFW